MDHSEITTNTSSIAHDLLDSSKPRSSDVELSENITFKDLKLGELTLLGLSNCGFIRPSPIQLETIPLGRCGLDMIIQSKAGTGKTCIFTLIALESLKYNPSNLTQTLVLAPTREIAIQIHQVISGIGSSYPDLKCALCIGGVEVKQDRIALTDCKDGKRSCQIVVGSPGRVKQLIEIGVLKTHHIELLVLDEADKLMEEQFKTQIDEIFKRLPDDKQMIVTSATFPNELSTFLERYMHSPKTIRIGKELALEAIEELYIESKAGHSGKRTLENKIETLKLLICNLSFNKCFIFTNFQARAPIICDNLNKDEEFVKKCGQINYISAELSQQDRIIIFEKFKSSDQKALISTDVSARGIDIRDIELVLNFDLPLDNTTYYHRIGRAGRFGQPGKAITIVSADNLDRAIFEKNIRTDRIKKFDLH